MAVGDWAPAAPSRVPALVFLRAGGLARRYRGREAVVDPGFAYLRWEGEVEQVRHLGRAGHSTTAIAVTSACLAGFGVEKDDDRLPLSFPTSPQTDLLHRRLVATASRGACVSADDVRSLVYLSACDILRARRPGGHPVPMGSREAVVNEVLEILMASHGLQTLNELAATVGVSAHHLSRLFHETTGLTLRQHRSRFRVRLALNRLAEGCRDLSAVAYDLGFADHAHFTRTMRRQLGLTPRDVRTLLSTAAAPADGARAA